MRAKCSTSDVKKETRNVIETCCGGFIVPDTSDMHTHTKSMLPIAESTQRSMEQEGRESVSPCVSKRSV